jgi:hypothetical protein
MTRDDIIRMAREAWLSEYGSLIMLAGEDVEINVEDLERFAALVAAAEREACAKVCEEYETENDITAMWLNIVADAIRARGERG